MEIPRFSLNRTDQMGIFKLKAKSLYIQQFQQFNQLTSIYSNYVYLTTIQSIP